MFDAKDLDSLAPECLNIIMVNKYDVTVMNQNTIHYWYVYCIDVPRDMVCVVLCKYK